MVTQLEPTSRKAETRARLRAVALRLFRDRGYDDTTIEQIAAAAGVTSRTFFRHYSTKEEVLFLESDRLERAGRLLDARPSDESIFDSMREVMREFGHVYDDDHGRFVQLLEIASASSVAASRAAQVEEKFTTLISSVIHQRGPDGPHHPRIIAAAIMGAIRSAVEIWFLSASQADPMVHLDEAFAVVERAFPPSAHQADAG